MPSVTKEVSNPMPPIATFDVTANCDNFTTPVYKATELPPQYSSASLSFRREVLECKSNPNEWCTKVIWHILFSYKFKSDASDAQFSGKEEEIGIIECPCDCVKLLGQLCISGKVLASSGLQQSGGKYYTDYNVEFTASFEGKIAKRWEQRVRVEGSRSWYGYYYNKCFKVAQGDKKAVSDIFSQEGLSAPGFDAEP